MTRPNLIYIFADQLRYDACGFSGNPNARTPNIDKFASQSMSFSNAVSNSPVCAPYRATLFTGKYSSSTGMVINELRVDPNHRCIGHILGDAKYSTAYIGKWHLWANQLGHHDETRNSFCPPGKYRLGFDDYWAAYNFNHDYYRGFYHENTPERIEIDGYEPDGQTDLAMNWLSKNAGDADKPFAMFLSYGTPHDSWDNNNVPEKYREMFKDVEFPLSENYCGENDPHADTWGSFTDENRKDLQEWMRNYYAMVANLDENIGRLMEHIDKMGLAENTIVVFTSDHGEMFGGHGRRAKNIFYDEAIRVPVLIRQTGEIPAGSLSDACLSTVDILPTLCGLMDLESPGDVEGMDISDAVCGRVGHEPEAAFLQGMGCTADWRDGYEWRAVRSKRFTYAIYHSDKSELLFDNQNDPLQMKNLISEPAFQDALDSMRKMLANKMAELGDTFECCTWYRENWTQDRCILRSATMNN